LKHCVNGLLLLIQKTPRRLGSDRAAICDNTHDCAVFTNVRGQKTWLSVKTANACFSLSELYSFCLAFVIVIVNNLTASRFLTFRRHHRCVGVPNVQFHP